MCGEFILIAMGKWPNLIAVTGTGIHELSEGEFTIPAWYTAKAPSNDEASYYGLSWSRDQIFLQAAPDKVCIFSNEKDAVEVLNVHSYRGALHQIHYQEGILYLASNFDDKVELFSPINKQVVDSIDLKPNVSTNPRKDTDYSHVNSVFSNGKNLYVVHHNWDNGSYIDVLDLNFKVVRQIGDIGIQNHNVCVIDETLYTLSSWTTEIVRVNLKTEERERVKFDLENLPITDEQRENFRYLRGLAVTEDYLVIGITWSGGRDKRDTVQSFVGLFDRETLKWLDVKELPATGQIREVRVIHERDYAHNGIEIPEIK